METSYCKHKMGSQIPAVPFTLLHQKVINNMQLGDKSVQLELLCTVAFHKQHILFTISYKVECHCASFRIYGFHSEGNKG